MSATSSDVVDEPGQHKLPGKAPASKDSEAISDTTAIVQSTLSSSSQAADATVSEDHDEQGTPSARTSRNSSNAVRPLEDVSMKNILHNDSSSASVAKPIPTTNSTPSVTEQNNSTNSTPLGLQQNENARAVPPAIQAAPSGRGTPVEQRSLSQVMPVSILRTAAQTQPNHHFPQQYGPQTRPGSAQSLQRPSNTLNGVRPNETFAGSPAPPYGHPNGPPHLQNMQHHPPPQHMQPPPPHIWQAAYPPPGMPWMTHCPSCGFVAGTPWPPQQQYQQHPQFPQYDPRGPPQHTDPQPRRPPPLVPLPDNSQKTRDARSVATGQTNSMMQNGSSVAAGRPTVPLPAPTLQGQGQGTPLTPTEGQPDGATSNADANASQDPNKPTQRQQYRRLKTEERRDILLMRKLGYTIDAIAKYLDASPAAVTYTCRRGTAETNHHLAGRRINMPPEKIEELCNYAANYLKQQVLQGRHRKTGKRKMKDLTYAMIRQQVFTKEDGTTPPEWKFTDEGIKKTLNSRGIHLKRPMTEQLKEQARAREKARWIQQQKQKNGTDGGHGDEDGESASKDDNPLRSDSSDHEDTGYGPAEDDMMQSDSGEEDADGSDGSDGEHDRMDVEDRLRAAVSAQSPYSTAPPPQQQARIVDQSRPPQGGAASRPGGQAFQGPPTHFAPQMQQYHQPQQGYPPQQRPPYPPQQSSPVQGQPGLMKAR